MKSLPKILTAIILTLMVSGAYSNFLNNGGKWLQNAEPWVEGDTIIDPYSPATGSDTLPLDTEEVVMKYLPGEVRDTAALFADTVRHTQILAKIALIARSFVLAPDRVVTVTLSDLRCKAFLSVDGGSFEMRGGDTLIVRKARHKTVIAHVGEKAFYDVVFEKLGEAK